MKLSLFTGIFAATIGIGLNTFDAFKATPTVKGKYANDSRSNFYWYYVEPDGNIYSYSLAFTGPRSYQYASTYGGCYGNFTDCMRGFLYPVVAFPDDQPGDISILKAF